MMNCITQARGSILSHPITKTIDKHLRRQVVKGFTLIEVMIVVSVMGVLASATTSRISNQQGNARNVARSAIVGQVASNATTYFNNNRSWPSNLAALKNYMSTTPTDPRKINTCNTAATANGELGYATYINGGTNQDKDGFMIFSQLERGGRGVDYHNIYILTGTSPCEDSTLGSGKVDRYRIANSVCTSKPGWTDNNPGRNGVVALNSLQQDVSDVFGNRKAYAAYVGTGARTKPWVGTGSNDTDGDQTTNGSDSNSNNPCIPSQFGRNCDTDTDDDNIYDPVEGNNSDTDSDGIPDFRESAINDRDGDSVGDQYDNDRPNCNGLAATIYVSHSIAGVNYIIGGPFNMQTYAGTINTSNGNTNNVIVATAGNDTINANNGNDTICAGDGNNTINANEGKNTIIAGNGDDTINVGNGNDIIVAGNGTNTINANNGNNYIMAGNGNDTITANNGNDQVIAGDGNNTVHVNGGGNIVIAGNGNDTITSNNGNDNVVAGAGIDTVHVNGGTDKVQCTPGGSNDTVTSAEICSGCQGVTCGNTNVGTITITFPSVTGTANPPSANTATCNQITVPISGDTDNDSYVNAVGPQANYGNADSDANNACIPNSLTYVCSPKSTLPGGTCYDNDDDDYFNNVYHTLNTRDPQDQDPCNPNPYSTACVALQNIDVDEDGYKPNVTSGGSFDPNDNDPCIPRAFRAGCGRDTDLDTKTDFVEGEFVNTDTFFAYADTGAHLVYSITGYAAILGGPSELSSGDNLYNRQESDRLTSSTGVVLNADPDGDGYTNELDPVNDGSIYAACIPNNFAPGCILDFDQDGIPDSQEGSGANTDSTGSFVTDIYPNWIESLFTNTLNYLGLFNPAGNTGDPDLDGVPNQLDPDNGDKCIPNTGFDSSCIPPAPIIPPPPPVGIDCASMTSLPYGARAYYIMIY